MKMSPQTLLALLRPSSFTTSQSHFRVARFAKEQIKPLKDTKQPAWQHSQGGSSLSKKKINRRTMDLLKGEGVEQR
jgi:hypothetical protein